ncbi:MAG TPA: TRAP transporter substrate-binding protein, partial [bacterium]|nr:TRAP transporter substrate-binding protein [bacterium]
GGAVLASTASPFVIRSASAQQDQVTLRYASLFPPQHSASRSAEWFAGQVAQRTGGKVKVQVFHNAALGGEEQVGEGVRSGTIDMGYAGIVGYGGLIRDIRVLEMPYLYKNLDELKLVVDKVSPILQQLFTANGLLLLGYQYDGPRMTLSVRSLKSIADFKGLKFRVPQSPLYIEMVQGFGAIPTPVAFPEVYTALQTHVAEAMEGSASTLLTGKYYEVAKNLVRTDHIFYAAYVAMNPARFHSLPADAQRVILEAGRESSAYNLQLARQANQDDLDRLVKVVQDVTTPDRAPFEAAVRPVNEKFAASLGGRAMEIYGNVKAVTKR